jgi:hypothetical protein
VVATAPAEPPVPQVFIGSNDPAYRRLARRVSLR